MYPLKTYPFPTPRYHRRLPPWTYSVEMEHPERYRDFSTNVIRWMGRNALRQLRAHEKAGQQFPTVEDLAAWLEEITVPKAQAVMDDTKSKWRTSADDISAKALEAASWALANYSSLIYVRAAKGGSKSKRRSKHSLEGLEGLSIAQQATALGVSLSTISRLRRAAAAAEKTRLDSIAPGAEIEPDDAWLEAWFEANETPAAEPKAVSENESEQAVYDAVATVYTTLMESPVSWVDSWDAEAHRAAVEAEGAARLQLLDEIGAL